MFPRKILFPSFVLLAAAVIFVGGACKNSKAEAERTESLTAAPVVEVSPTPKGQPISVAAVGNLNDIAYLNVKGRKIAVLAFAFNPISYNLLDIESSRRVVADMARKVDIVIVVFHGGAEGAVAQHVPHGPETYLGAPRGDLRAFTHAVVDAGAGLVIGSSPHVVRAMEVYKGHLIAYSLGNFAFYRVPFAGPTALSLVLDTNIGPHGEFLGGKIHPLIQEGQNGPRPDPRGAVINVMRELSKEDFGPTAVNIAQDGTVTAP